MMALFPHAAEHSSGSCLIDSDRFPAVLSNSNGARAELPLSSALRHDLSTDHDLTVVVPAYNEARRLPRTLDGLAEYLSDWGIDYRVLVVDDGSRDGTADLVEGHGHRFFAIRQENGGKGSAVRNGMLRATGQVVAFTDADLPYDLDALRAGYEQVTEQGVDVVFGARDLKESTNLAPRKLVRSVAHEIFRQCMRVLVSRQVGDTQCGLKVFSRRAATEIFSLGVINGFAFDAEVVYLTHALNYSYSRQPVVLVNEYASTISLTQHALPMLLDVLKMRWRALIGGYQIADRASDPGKSSEAPTIDIAALRRRPAA